MPLPPERRAALVAALLLALVARPAAGQDAPPDFPAELKSVARVRVVGRHRVPAKELWGALKTRRPSVLPWATRAPLRLDFLRADTAAIAGVYRRHGYLDAVARVAVTSTGDPREAEIAFIIEEGRQSRIRRVDFTGVTAYPEDQLRRKLYSRVGRPFNPAYLIVDTTRISSAYQERGYIPRVHGSMTRDSLDVAVRFDVAEGPLYRFGEVQVLTTGEPQVPPAIIRRELLVRKGEVYRSPRVERSIERLYQTGLFNQVQMTALPDSALGTMDFDLRVRERKPRWVDAGVGSGTAERFRATGEWGHRNLFHRAMTGGTGLEYAADAKLRFSRVRATATIGEPWLFGTRTAGFVNGFIERGDDRTDGRWLIRRTTRSVNFVVRRELGRFARASLSQQNDFVEQSAEVLDTALTFAVRDSLERETVPRYTTHRLRLTVDRDLRDQPFSPTRGSIQSLTGEIAGGPLKGTSSFYKAELVSSWYTPIKPGWILAARMRAGAIDPFGERSQFTPLTASERVARVPLSDRFRTGGVNSIRGYEENSIPVEGGLAVLQGSLELRVSVAGPFGLELFADGGNVWPQFSQIRLAAFTPRVSRDPLDPSEVRYVVGLGPRLDLPIGPLRLDLSWNLRPVPGRGFLAPAVQFAVGPAF